MRAWQGSPIILLILTFDLWVWPSPLRYKPPHHGKHACPVTWESYDAWLRCELDKGSPIKLLILTSKRDLDLWGTGLSLERDTPPHHGERLCQVSLKSYDAWLKCGSDKVQSFQIVLISTFDMQVWPWHLRCRPGSCASQAASSRWTFVPSFFKILWCMVEMQAGQGTVLSNSTHFDLDIWGTGLGLVRDMLSHHGERLCQASFQSYDAWLRCQPDNVRWDWQTDRRTDVKGS